MTSIGLLFAGSVLLINGLGLLGYCDAAETVPVNAFVGALLVDARLAHAERRAASLTLPDSATATNARSCASVSAGMHDPLLDTSLIEP